jgi:hypothetical protein
VDFFIAFCFSTAWLFLIHAPTANAETTLRNGLAGSINNGTKKNIPGQCQNVIAVLLQRNLKFAHWQTWVMQDEIVETSFFMAHDLR